MWRWTSITSLGAATRALSLSLSRERVPPGETGAALPFGDFGASAGHFAPIEMVLTKGQKEALHGAMLEYMQAEGFTSAAAEFEREASVAKVAAAGTLEKKWSSVVRQQRKIGELEKKVADMTEELANGGGGGGSIGGKKRYGKQCAGGSNAFASRFVASALP